MTTTPAFAQAVERQYSQVNDLWERVENGSTQNLNPDQTEEVKRHILSARDSLMSANKIVGGAG